LPAEILGADSCVAGGGLGVGKIFDWEKSALNNEKDYLASANQLSVQQFKSHACRDAIRSAKVIDDNVKALCSVQ
jgi:hypothetical protein